LILLILIDCSIGGYIGLWREWYWNSLSNKDFLSWTKYVIEFTIAALASCAISGYTQYLINILSLSKRTKLTGKYFKSEKFFIEGFEQRIQDDCKQYPILLFNIGISILRSIIMIIAFSYIIISHINIFYLLIPFIYAFFGTFIAGKIAFPLINLNYINQVVEAKFRQSLNRLNYLLTHKNNRNLYIKTKHLQYFQSFFSQITVIFPHLVLASLYFSGKIIFGVFMQVAAAMSEITNSLSIIILNLNDINNLLSCHKRLKEIKII
jgi:putative ATP-binding cassette transporter